MADQTLNANVARRVDVTPELAIVRVAPRGWELPDFLPGQWATLGLPRSDGEEKLVKRVYSIASPPGESELEFYLQLVKHGQLTEKLWDLVEGDALFVDPVARGKFTLEPVPQGADLVLIATGTGLAPFVSMLKHHRGSGRWGRAVVVHGVRYAADLGYHEELSRIAAEDADVVYLPTVTREPEDAGWPGLRGRVGELFEGDAWAEHTGAPLDPDRTHVFLCGNPAMIDDMEKVLEPRGFTHHKKDTPGNLHFERYW